VTRILIQVRISPRINEALRLLDVGSIPGRGVRGGLEQGLQPLLGTRVLAGVQVIGVDGFTQGINLDFRRLGLGAAQVFDDARGGDAGQERQDQENYHELKKREAPGASYRPALCQSPFHRRSLGYRYVVLQPPGSCDLPILRCEIIDTQQSNQHRADQGGHDQAHQDDGCRDDERQNALEPDMGLPLQDSRRGLEHLI